MSEVRPMTEWEHRMFAELASLRPRLAEKEALLHEATMLLFDWDALVGGTGSHATETRDFLARVGYDPMTATLRKADSAPVRSLAPGGLCPKCGRGWFDHNTDCPPDQPTERAEK